MRTHTLHIGLRSVIAAMRARRSVSPARSQVRRFGRLVGYRLVITCIALLLPVSTHALTSTSYILYEEPGEATQAPQTSTSYRMNEDGISWYQAPLASTSFQIVSAPPVSSSSASSTQASESGPEAGAPGGRRPRPETVTPVAPTPPDAEKPAEEVTHPVAPGVPYEGGEETGAPIGAQRPAGTALREQLIFIPLCLDVLKCFGVFSHPSAPLGRTSSAIPFLLSLLFVTSLLTLLSYGLYRLHTKMTLLLKTLRFPFWPFLFLIHKPKKKKKNIFTIRPV